MPPPPAMHQSFSDDAVHQHHQQHQHQQHQQHQQHHHQQQRPQYTHVPSADFAGYATGGGFYGDASSSDLGFGQQMDANQAGWSQAMSPSAGQGMFGADPHQQHRHHAQQQQPGSQQQQQAQQAQQQAQQQQQQQQAPQFNYATQHFGHFNPQQLAALPQEIQAPRPAW